jgi:hypothetical protein
MELCSRATLLHTLKNICALLCKMSESESEESRRRMRQPRGGHALVPTANHIPHLRKDSIWIRFMKQLTHLTKQRMMQRRITDGKIQHDVYKRLWQEIKKDYHKLQKKFGCNVEGYKDRKTEWEQLMHLWIHHHPVGRSFWQFMNTIVDDIINIYSPP